MPLNLARLNVLVVTVLALLAPLSVQAKYIWSLSTPDAPIASPSPMAACKLALTGNAAGTSDYRRGFTLHGPIEPTTKLVRCSYQELYWGNWIDRYIMLTRFGDGCDSGTLYDPNTGECIVPDKDCKAETGDILTRGSIAGIVVSNGRTYSLSQSPASACVDSCSFALKDTGRPRYTSCYLVKGSQVDSFCNYILTGTGEPCSGWNWTQPETGDPLNPADTPDAPPSDPNDPGCPKGWSWSGTTCVKTPTDGDGGGDKEGDKDKDPSGGGGVGGGGDKDPGGDGQDGGTDGDKDKDKDPGSGTGGGKDPDKGSSLKPPKAGSFDNANKEWAAKAEQARQLFNDKLKQQMNSFKGVFDVNLGQGAGSLPCERFTVLGQTLSICLTDYATELAYLRQILLLVASVIAATIVLRD
ncbi:attachment protein [Metapseudomonas otitidis]|uniref:attachment protein n=1 Tax=Metapseudomonas otitidis TaxID=319939 RepID=UPI0013F60A5D|nr:attachment protein [Pseudomonas otitidis]